MRISDSERARIAEKLRERADDPWMELGDLCEDIGCDVRRGEEAAVFRRLADLIDPECRHEEFCRVCGHVIPDGWSECPKCRSKVVRDDNR